MSVDTVMIDDRVVGDGRVFVIAELSANHGGSIARAKETIHAAADAGADAIKLQTYRPESITIESDQPSSASQMATCGRAGRCSISTARQ